MNINEGSRRLGTSSLATTSDINLSSEIVPNLSLTLRTQSRMLKFVLTVRK